MGQTLPLRVFPERTKMLWSVRVWLARLVFLIDGVKRVCVYAVCVCVSECCAICTCIKSMNKGYDINTIHVRRSI